MTPAWNSSVSRIDLAVGDRDNVGGDIGGHIAGLRFDDGQSRQGAAAQRVAQAGGTLQKAAVEIEHIAGIRLASGRTADQQGDGAVGHGVLAQIVIDHQNMLALMHEVFAYGAAGIGRDVLQGRLLGGGGADNDGVVHGAGALQRVYQLRHGRALLTDGHIDADDVLCPSG